MEVKVGYGVRNANNQWLDFYDNENEHWWSDSPNVFKSEQEALDAINFSNLGPGIFRIYEVYGSPIRRVKK